MDPTNRSHPIVVARDPALCLVKRMCVYVCGVRVSVVLTEFLRCVWYVCFCMFVYLCVCVCERERSLSCRGLHVHVYIYVCVCVCVFGMYVFVFLCFCLYMCV